MSSVSIVNSRADVLRKSAALAGNCNASKGLQEVLKSNLGPRGTLKMLVGGAGQTKVTKDGCVLLNEMQIQHPTASMIARAATAQDAITGDGTTSNVLLIGELLRTAERAIWDGMHPRLICDGYDIARKRSLEILDEMKVSVDIEDKEVLLCVARTSLGTKLSRELAEQMAGIVVDAVKIVRRPNENQVDLHMVEVLSMKQRLSTETRLIRGMVMDHGPRHPEMPKRLKNCFILTCNVSLEYEKSEVNAGFFYNSPEQRDRLVAAERRFTDQKVRKIIELKEAVCTLENKKSFVVLNQKGIDPPSLDLLCKAGIMALRRVKRRNMERLTLCCGGNALNAVDDLTIEDLGFAEDVWEESLGDDKFTFVEGVAHPTSCAILIKGPNDHSIAQIKDAIRDGLRAVTNTILDGCLVPGAGAFEIACHSKLSEYARKEIRGKTKIGVLCFAESILVIPKTLAENSGLDSQETTLKLSEEFERTGKLVGLDLTTGEPILPAVEGIWDNYSVKRQMLSICPTLAEQLMLVDEVIRAGKSMGRE